MPPRWDQYASCHLWGHAWEEVAGDWTPAYGGVPMTLRCMRCTMERRDTVGENTGEVVGRRYVEPEGYYWQRSSDDEARPTRVDYRMSWINRHIVDARKARPKRRLARAS